jgi:hypothetical protein
MKTIAVICALLVFAAGVAFFEKKPQESSTNFGGITFSEGNTSPTSTTSQPPTLPKIPGAHAYINDQYGFALYYPESLQVRERKESGNALTITFQNVPEAQGFQIYIVPYKGTQVSEEQFRKDAPSGVRSDLKAATIDGVSGAAFYGRDTLLGDTREIWFIRGGYLYEVTTLKPLDSWLQSILATWKFF